MPNCITDYSIENNQEVETPKIVTMAIKHCIESINNKSLLLLSRQCFNSLGGKIFSNFMDKLYG